MASVARLVPMNWRNAYLSSPVANCALAPVANALDAITRPEAAAPADARLPMTWTTLIMTLRVSRTPACLRSTMSATPAAAPVSEPPTSSSVAGVAAPADAAVIPSTTRPSPIHVSQSVSDHGSVVSMTWIRPSGISQ
jgi:hypothetical protein